MSSSRVRSRGASARQILRRYLNLGSQISNTGKSVGRDHREVKLVQARTVVEEWRKPEEDWNSGARGRKLRLGRGNVCWNEGKDPRNVWGWLWQGIRVHVCIYARLSRGVFMIWGISYKHVVEYYCYDDSQRTTLIRKLHKMNYPLPLSCNAIFWRPTVEICNAVHPFLNSCKLSV